MKGTKVPWGSLSTNEAQQELRFSRRGCRYRNVVEKLGCGRAGCVFASEVSSSLPFTPQANEDGRVALRFIKRQHRNRESHHLMSELYTHWVLSGHPAISTLRTVLLTDNYIVIVTDLINGTSLSSFCANTLHSHNEESDDKQPSDPKASTVTHEYDVRNHMHVSAQQCDVDHDASGCMPLHNEQQVSSSWRRMSEPVSSRAAHAGVTVIEACSDSEDEDLFLSTSPQESGIRMHGAHDSSTQAHHQRSRCAFTAKRRTDPVAGATTPHDQRRWLRENMYGGYGEVAQHDLEQTDLEDLDDEELEQKTGLVEPAMVPTATLSIDHVWTPHAKRLSESAAQQCSNTRARSQCMQRQSSPGADPSSRPSRHLLATKRYSEPGTVHVRPYTDHSTFTSPEIPSCSRPFTQPYVHQPARSPSKAQNIPQRQAHIHSKAGPSHMHTCGSPFSNSTFSPQETPKACSPVTNTHVPASIERTTTPEATQLRTCIAPPDATVHGRAYAPLVARLFSQDGNDARITDSDDEETYTINPSSRGSFESSTASGALGTSPYSTLRPPTRLRASLINVTIHTTNSFNSPVKCSQPKRSQNIPKGSCWQQMRGTNSSLKLQEGSPSMATPLQGAPLPNVLGGSNPGLNQLSRHSHCTSCQSCAASLVSSSSDCCKLSAGTSSSQEACMLFMHASQKYSAQVGEQADKRKADTADARHTNSRPGASATTQHAQHTQHAFTVLSDSRWAGASSSLAHAKITSRGKPTAEEHQKVSHEDDCRNQRMHVVRRIFQQLVSLLEASHEHDVFLGALHPHNVMVTWEKGDSQSNPRSVRVHVTSAGYLRELHELDVRPFQQAYSAGKEAAAAGVPGYLQRFMPPEQLQGMPRSADGDVWAAGALLFFLLCGREPFPLESSTQHRAWQNRMVHAPESLDWPAEFEHDKGPSSARELVESMLQPLETRAILEQVLNHPWVTSTSPCAPMHAPHDAPAPEPAIYPSPHLSPASPPVFSGRRSPFLCAQETETPSSTRHIIEASRLESSKLEASGNGRSRARYSQVGGDMSLHALTDPQDADSQSTPTHAQMHMCTPVIHSPEREVLQAAADDPVWGEAGRVKLQLPHVPLKDREVLQKDISDLIIVASEPSRAPLQRQ